MPDPTAPPADDEPAAPPPDLPAGLVLEEPPTGGSKNEHVRNYRSWLEANPKTSVRLPDFTGDTSTKDAQGTVAAFHRIEGMHATAQTVNDGLSRVWVTFDPETPRKARKVAGTAKKATGRG